MSGDTQPKKRKDKKRKKDDEDTVKETIAHAPKQPSSGAAQAAKEPGDVQMHIHSDHGTGGNWCAKVVFFILLAGLGALIGLILIENQGLSNEDTPLSESRYSEFFNGWVDETRQDDHHHEEILAAINSLDDHDDDDGEAHHVVDDHDDDEHDQDGGDGDHDDGTPYAEEEDHDDDGTDVQDDDEDEGPAQKLDDDEVEEIFTQQEAAEQQAATVDDDDDDDDDGQDDGDDDDDDDAGANGNPNLDDDDDNDDKNDNFNNKQDDDNDDDDDDDDDTKTDDDKDNDELEKKSDNVITKTNLDNNDDDDDENDKDNDDDENEEAAKGKEDFDGDEDEEELVGSEQDFDEPAVRSNTGATVADDDDDDDDVFVERNAGFADADDDQDDNVFDEEDENDNDNFDGDEDEIEAVTRGSQSANEGNDNNVDDDNDEDDDDDDVDDGKADFSEFVDNDGGEEEYLEKIRSEQQRRAADEEKRRAAVEPEEETSLTVKIFVGVALIGAAHLLLTSPRAPTKKPTSKGDGANVQIENTPTNDGLLSNAKLEPKDETQLTGAKSILDDFVYANPKNQSVITDVDMTEENVAMFDDNDDDAERYSGDDYEYEMEEIEEDYEQEEEKEKILIKQEEEIGAFVPITFEDFNSMYRSPTEEVEVVMDQKVHTTHAIAPEPLSKKGTKDSLLARKKPPKGALNKLIYGLHKDPIVIPSGAGESETEPDRMRDRETLAEPSGNSQVSATAAHSVREKHVEFRLPEREETEFELEPVYRPEHTALHPGASDNGSKENLFVPDASEEEPEPDEYAEEYDEYEGEEEIVYEEEEVDDEIESVLLNQYGSDEEEEPLTDDNIPPGGEYDEASDVDDSDLMRRLEEKYGKLPASASTTAASNSEAAGPDGDDDEATAAGWTKIPSRAEEADRSYQEELRRAERQLDEKDPEKALAAYDRIIVQQPNSIAALIGRARALDALAEQRRSNSILTEAITAYRKVLEQDLAVDDATLKSMAERCLDRMRFQGQHAKAIEVHKMLIRRFDHEPLYRNQLAVSYLYMNRLQEAKAVLHDTLLRWIGDGFALVHYGFVLKTLDQNMELAAQYLQEGIDTDHEGTQDGRFYFQLGDALQRLGRNSEALNVYRKGVEKKLFLSLYQRSLYNVDGLRSRPFWTQEQTTHGRELELIRAQWTQIRDEGLALLSSEGVFVNETENLRDRGDWKQLELFSRGARLERNCARAPLTCRLVEQHFPAARSCKRGQVKFSVMHPGTHVWPHCGPTNCRVRAHLGLSVPAGTSIRVAEETRSWENGKWLIFDDSFEHEVWHNGTATRLVLIVDFWHPDLSESQRRTLTPI
ncbi:uncharacterized protein LOC128724720 [Anopheles nili]|uniref:uncharacterized protein LOC128724720 n=1 Tax=Anopheles nili TaxID=185578 RepID=UPI00237A1770|nr:uncharacterized protein LOC128724720 [Anopheles nili]